MFPCGQNKQSRQYACKLNTEPRSRDYCYRGKVIRITYSECVPVALVTQNATSMRRIVLSSLAYPVLQHFSSLFHKRQHFQNKFTEYKMRAFIVSTNFIRNFAL